jgi:hypothetical protein
MLSRVALVKIDVSEELSAYMIRVTKIGELERSRNYQPMHAASRNVLIKTIFVWGV